MHFRFVAQSSRSTSVIFNNPKVCTRPKPGIVNAFSKSQTIKNIVHGDQYPF
jgi:hypothetical protein